jgi:hypothetical protein
MIGLLGRFFVPICHYSLRVSSDDEIVTNWNLAMSLMKRVTVDTSKVNLDAILSEDNISELSKVIFLIQQVGPLE